MKIVVIGAGLLGVSSAYYLSRQGHQVVVLERQEQPGMETSFANGGMLTPSQADPWNQPGIFSKILFRMGKEDSPFLLRPNELLSLMGWGWLFLLNSSPERFYRNLSKNARLASYSLQVLQEIKRRHSFVYDSTSKGTLKIYNNETKLTEALGLSELYQQLGVQYRTLGVNEVFHTEPALKDARIPISGGIYYPDDESGDAHKFCQCLAVEAAKAGVEFKYRVIVSGFSKQADRIMQVNTSQGVFTADAYLLAAGSYSVPIARSLGMKLPIRPVKGYSLTLPFNGWESRPQMPVIDDAMHISVTPLGDRLRVAGTAELAGFNTTIRQDRIESMFKIIEHIYPAFIPHLDRTGVTEWSGLRPYSCDGVPILGRTALRNLYLNTGHGHLGWTMAAGSGRLIADVISGRAPEIDVKPYQLDRF